MKKHPLFSCRAKSFMYFPTVMKTCNVKSQATLISLGLVGAAMAGSSEPIFEAVPLAPPPSKNADAFSNLVHTVTNPTLFDLAVPRTQIRPIFLHHRFPDRLNLADGSQLDFGGDLQLYALQFEYALTDRLSIVAMKDGFVDFNPDNTDAFESAEGFANIGGGLKYAFILDPENDFAASVSALFEFPWGTEDVFQGEGDGVAHLTVQTVKAWDRLQLAAGAGIQVPLDDSFSTQGFFSAHLSYRVSKWFIPLVEFNYFTVFDEGDGGTRFDNQVGGAVPGAVRSEGADLLNLGASNSTDYITAAVGFRSNLTDNLALGFAYEFPLSDSEDNITDDRFTIDAVITF